ncbi:hypothetical protein GCK72_014742 [Caenorhabditis remanei]|uniref:Uncharacterized protein n=1 Tax=Caenorhabditis remanei TaxID=31234 RepID=A0A6A5GUF4_CAERE|nr:hypothetical protein GCK72_014742 [Caenorhabditis remanei]KAF1758284.1 hypothetical protein GCK72_014742 [Caenorhabditis remanei]
MKKLKRRLSAAFRPGSNNNVSITSSGGSFYDSECEARNNIVIGYGMMSAPLHGRAWTLSESMSHLSDKNGAIMEECGVDPTALLRVSRGGTAGRRYDTNVNYINGMHVPPPRTHSLYYPRGYNSRRNSYYGSNACKFFFSKTNVARRTQSTFSL